MHIAKGEMANMSVCILYDSNYIRYWKRQNYGDSNKISGWQRLEGKRSMNRWGTVESGAVQLFYITLHDKCHAFTKNNKMFNTKSKL